MTGWLSRAAGVVLGLLVVAAGPVGAGSGGEELLLTVDATAYPSMLATVTLPQSVPVGDLSRNAFTIEENGQPRPLEVTRLPVDSLEVVLVIDTSGSMRGEPLAAAKAAATTFIGRMPASTRIAVVGFGPSPVVASPFTLDRQGLLGAVGGLQAAGETAIYDAIGAATALFAPGARKSLVLLSDGADTASRATFDETLARVGPSGVRLDAVALGTGLDTAALAAVATAGRGTLASAEDPAALAEIYDTIAAGLVNQYHLSYVSRSSGSTAVRVVVRTDGVTAVGETTVDLGPGAAPKPESAAGDVTARTWMLAAGAGAIFLALLLVGAALLRPSERARRMADRARLGRAMPDVGAAATALNRAAVRASVVADDALDRRGSRGSLNHALERAGVALRPGEFAVLALSAMTVGLLMGVLFSGLLLGLALAATVPLAARFALGVMADRRRRRFGDQLGDVLQLMSGSLRAGYALLQAMDTVAREAESPSAEEFRRFLLEARLGRDVSESLAAMSDRVGNDDFSWVVGAIEIHREVGGDLAEVLDTVAGTIRERTQLRRQVKALSAEGRISAYVLGVLPFGLLGVLSAVNPGYLQPLTEGGGLVLSGIGVVLMIVGVLWLRKICQLVY